MRTGRSVKVIVRLSGRMLMVMAIKAAGVQFSDPVRMLVRLQMMQILDLRFALATTADAAHHTTSISLSRISSPP
jgi:hypothetical protein